MENFDQKQENEKPWLNALEGLHRTYYPLGWNKQNSYTIFSPGIDRFLIIDNYDLWMVYETGKVLSSKVSNIVYVLDKDTPNMNNQNCLNFSTLHKKKESGYGGPMIMSHRQSTSMSKIPADMVLEVGWPIDFSSEERKQVLLKLQEYALFSLRTIYAITLAVNFKNFFPEKEYLDLFFHNEYPKDFKIRHDTTSAENGMIISVKKILYESDSVGSALLSIKNLWLTHSQDDPSGTRQLFYHLLGIHQPEELKAFGPPGFIKDRNNQTTWVV